LKFLSKLNFTECQDRVNILSVAARARGSFLIGQPISGRVVLVEFWATWRPPCRSILEWLGELKPKHGDKLAIVALAVESPEDQIHSTVNSLSPDLHWAIADAPTAQAFGDITAVPTLFLFDRSGKTSRILYGAPPTFTTRSRNPSTRY
jgi:thiol-disulfide isomerase/thioredoxin